MEIIIGTHKNLKHIKIEDVLEIKIKGVIKFRLKEVDGQLKVFTKDGILQIKPVASNLIIIDQVDDY